MVKTKSAKNSNQNFSVGDSVVYPSHGVGSIIAEEMQAVGGMEVSCYVITFDKDKMTLRVPKSRAEKAGLRQLASSDDLNRALITLKGKAKVEKGMWSKRAQKYEEKIYSGNVIHIAEVLRDLHRNVDDPSRSYSERVIYESAFQRFINEYAVSAEMNIEQASQKIRELLEEAKILNQDAA
ncbi:MAG: CarD family transcriptional regulator [Alphaproteobacteria bacterium]|jgi:CarD family transcriptional regulator|nr:CarD family transcriptional regulator [Candidatus Jidaibacter sp.]